MNLFKRNNLLVVMVMLLSACGGGGSSASNGSNAGDNNTNQPSQQQSFTAMTNKLFNASEDSAPVDISSIDMNMDADDDETAFSNMMEANTNQ